MFDTDLEALNNQELVELLASLKEMDNFLKDYEDALKEGCDDNECKL